jgi:hypothetical protein
MEAHVYAILECPRYWLNSRALHISPHQSGGLYAGLLQNSIVFLKTALRLSLQQLAIHIPMEALPFRYVRIIPIQQLFNIPSIGAFRSGAILLSKAGRSSSYATS